MNLLEPERSQFDWNFRLFGIAVRVQPMFWFVTLVYGFDILNDKNLEVPTRFFYLFLWMLAAFVSILVHEMGHVVVGNFYGSPGYIVLTGFFGLAVGSSDLSSRWQRIAVSFGGPVAGFLFIAAILGICALVNSISVQFLVGPYLMWRYPPPDWPEWILFLLIQLVWINLIWGMVNLLPIWPLDGGKVCRELCQEFIRPNGVKVSLIISLVTAGLFAINSLVGYFKGESLIPYLPTGSVFSAIFFGIFAFTSWQMLQQVNQSGGGGGGRRWVDEDYDRRAPWEQDADWWKRGR